MSDKREIHLMSEELKELEDEIKGWVREFGHTIKDAVFGKIDDLQKLMTTLFEANDKTHDELKAEYKEIRGSLKGMYERMNEDKEKVEKNITVVRLDLEKKIKSNEDEIDNIKLEPGKKASEILRMVARYIIILFVGMGVMAIIWWIAQGAPATNIPIP